MIGNAVDYLIGALLDAGSGEPPHTLCSDFAIRANLDSLKETDGVISMR